MKIMHARRSIKVAPMREQLSGLVDDPSIIHSSSIDHESIHSYIVCVRCDDD